MISKRIDDSTVFATPQDPDDMLSLRRIIRPGDRITAETVRVIKQNRDYSRPDRGEKTRIRISLEVQKISLDDALDRLRIHGTVQESSSESVSRGAHHSVLVRPGFGISITKKGWTKVQRKLASPGASTGFVLISADRTECGVARLEGTRVKMLPNIYSGAAGKRYKTSFKTGPFFESIMQALGAVISKGDPVVIFGPGETKRRLGNYLAGFLEKKACRTSIIEGIDAAGEDGIRVFTRSDAMRDALAGSKLAEVSGIIDEVMRRAGNQSARFSMGYRETRKAVEQGAAESVVFSDSIINDRDESEIMDLLDTAEASGARVYGADSSTDLGLRVSGLGGIVALLRFAAG